MKGDTKANQHQEHLGCIEKNSEQQTVWGNTRISSCFASKRHDWLRKVSARKNRIRPSSSGLQLRISRCSSKLPQVQQNELELNGYQIGTHALQVCTSGQPIIWGRCWSYNPALPENSPNTIRLGQVWPSSHTSSWLHFGARALPTPYAVQWSGEMSLCFSILYFGSNRSITKLTLLSGVSPGAGNQKRPWNRFTNG